MNFQWSSRDRTPPTPVESPNTCGGCGTALDELTPEQISQAVEEVLEETRPQIQPLPGVCPLCGHSSTVPVSHRKSIQFGLLLAALVVASALVVLHYTQRSTDRQAVAAIMLRQLQSNADTTHVLGAPIIVDGTIGGQVKQDETGWQEARLTVPVRGPKAQGSVKIVGGRSAGDWTFTTFELVVVSAKKRLDLVAGTVTEYDRDAYVDTHTEAAGTAEFLRTTVPPARWDGTYPCISTLARPGPTVQIRRCETPVPIAALKAGPVDGFQVDLRSGKFILRQTDLLLKDADWTIPLTRTYASQFWAHRSTLHAFGRNSTHDFDIAPVGTRNPYTYQAIVLPTSEFLYMPRISRGGGYADAVYQHSETSSGFYGAMTRWAGNGWETKLDDGAVITFPESYNARNMAQGAPTRMVDAKGNVLSLIRDPQRNLSEIRTLNGHWIKFAYDGQSRVIRAESDRGDWVSYGYDSDGMLADVGFSDGRARHYTYVPALLTWVHDEAGRVLIHNWYRDWKVFRQDYADGTSSNIRYTMAGNKLYVEEAVVTMPDGSTTTIHPADTVSQLTKEQSVAKDVQNVLGEVWSELKIVVGLLYAVLTMLLVRGPSRVTRSALGMICAAVLLMNVYLGIAATLASIAIGVKIRRPRRSGVVEPPRFRSERASDSLS